MSIFAPMSTRYAENKFEDAVKDESALEVTKSMISEIFNIVPEAIENSTNLKDLQATPKVFRNEFLIYLTRTSVLQIPEDLNITIEQLASIVKREI